MKTLKEFFLICFTTVPLRNNVERRHKLRRPRAIVNSWKQARKNVKLQSAYNAYAVFAVVLALSLSVSAQTAKVMALSDKDAAEAQRLFDAVSTARQALAGFKDKIRQNYLARPVEGAVAKGWTTFSYLKPGWEWDFEFSEDYKYIVPNHPNGVVWTSPQNWVQPTTTHLDPSTTGYARCGDLEIKRPDYTCFWVQPSHAIDLRGDSYHGGTHAKQLDLRGDSYYGTLPSDKVVQK